MHKKTRPHLHAGTSLTRGTTHIEQSPVPLLQ